MNINCANNWIMIVSYILYVMLIIFCAASVTVDKLPFCLRILLEQCIRKCHDFHMTSTAVCNIVHWQLNVNATVPFHPARVIFQVFT